MHIHNRFRAFQKIKLALALALACAGWCASEAASLVRPNIVFLLTDDQRWDTLGCMGNRIIQTPHLDRLAADGTLFRNAFVTTSICAVSRASFLSGQYQRRHKIDDFSKTFSPEAWSQTYPALLRQHGYRTGFIGKYGVGKEMPEKEFDFWRGFPGQGQFFEKGETQHLTAKMGDQALEFLKSSSRSQPFCLSISFKAPHAQDNAPREFPPDPRDEILYAGVTIPPAKTTDEKFYKALPEHAQKSEGRRRWERRYANPEMFQKTARDYYRLISGIDREVGRIRATLNELNLADNTIIVFSSDNGFFLGERGMADKWLMYEESIRVPLIIADPGVTAKQRGQTSDAFALNIDIAPTLLDYAGVPVPEAMQGKSLRPFVEGRNMKGWRRDFFYEHTTFSDRIPPSEGVRTDRWKYIRYIGVEPAIEELYDLKNDPFEERNLIASKSAQRSLNELRGQWSEMRRELE